MMRGVNSETMGVGVFWVEGTRRIKTQRLGQDDVFEEYQEDHYDWEPRSKEENGR